MTRRGSEKVAAMEDLLDELFDVGVRVASSPLVFRSEDLPAGERSLVERAVESRRREFSTGRFLARSLLKDLDVEVTELLRDEDRVPLWPDRVVGSISHCEELCVVAIAERTRFRGIGVDVEPDEAVKSGVERVVCRESEKAWLSAVTGNERGRRIKVIFSVKEAVYKAFYPELRTFWSFQDVETEIDLPNERFRARLPEGPEVREIEGRIRRRGGLILSSVCRAC